MKNSIRHILLCSAALMPSQIAAQSGAVIDLDPITVYGGLLPTTLDATGATIDLLDSDDLGQGGSAVGDSLAALPGVTVSANGGLGTRAAVRVRGLDASYLGVRVDGIEVTDPSSTQTSFNFGTLTSGTLDRITLVKGTQSAIYGSDAIAGMIDVQSWRPDTDGVSGRASLEYGSFNTRTATGSVGFRDARAELAFSLSRVTTDGFSARDSDDEDDGFAQTSANLFAAYQLTDALRVGVSGLWSDGTSEFDRSSSNSSGDTVEERSGLRAFAEFASGAWLHEVSLSGFRSDRYDAGGYTKEFIGERLKAAYLGRVTLSPMAELAFGLDWTEERAALDGSDFDASNAAAFGEVKLAPRDDLEISATLRYDDYSDFDGAFSGRAALAWRATGATTVRSSFGTGYRAPSLYERFGPYAGTDLESETSRSFDLGVEQQIGQAGTLRATAFYIEIDNLIQYDFASGGYAQVPGTTVSKGVELSAAYPVSDRLSLSGNYTYTLAETDGDRLTRVPRHELSLSADLEVTDRVSTGLTVTRVADILDGFGMPTPLDDYTLVDLTARYDLSDRTQAYATVRNLTDEEYETVRGYNTSERALYVGIRTDF
ncbi:TonB-dependent receptor plug domain-containing protein [Puniceibacterium confluentis]|uniref:TonB-dependent receptor plug domain-containing protein n=1 Tax=Puniceibacterium confluentis TaxID=1958944 RepID=UPI0035694CB2